MILVFGQTGQVARELKVFNDVVTLTRNQADLSNPISCANAIREFNPSAVINAAAFTAVDKAEEEEALATLVNGDAPTCMAKTCAEIGIPFVHISTDYVFDGTGEEPWSPCDTTNPQNAYGRSKEAGEKGVIASGAVYAILRSSWVVSSHGDNFIKTMLRLSETTQTLSVVSDQIGSPTAARDIANACYRIASALHLNPRKSGVYHFSGSPYVSWYNFAYEIFRLAKCDIDLKPILSADYSTASRRPLNSRLECSDIFTQFGIEQVDWRISLSVILEEMKGLS